jgi:hypothetical protein
MGDPALQELGDAVVMPVLMLALLHLSDQLGGEPLGLAFAALDVAMEVLVAPRIRVTSEGDTDLPGVRPLPANASLRTTGR